MKNNENLLVVFAKEPVPGRVKTRLSASLGVAKATRIYDCLLRYTLLEMDSPYFDLRVLKTPESRADYFASVAPVVLSDQQGDDLGARLANAFDEAFSLGYRRVIVIGSDCPTLTQEFIQEAFSVMRHKPDIIGPACDGGYYLIGLSAPASALFEDIRWSSEDVFDQTLGQATSLQRDLYRLPAQADIDLAEDLDAYCRTQDTLLAQRLKEIRDESN